MDNMVFMIGLILFLILLVAAMFLVKEIRSLRRELRFWRHAAITLSDRSFELLSKVKEAAIAQIEDGQVDPDDMPVIYLGLDEMTSLKYLNIKGLGGNLEKSAYRLFSEEVDRLRANCKRYKYNWLDEEDIAYPIYRG